MENPIQILWKLMLKVNFFYFNRNNSFYCFIVPITFISEPIQYAELNSVVLIKCRVIANPSADISWFKGQEKMNILSSNYEERNGGLQINRVSSIDNDTFWCQADVAETGESKDYQIQVIIARMFLKSD